MSSKPKLFARYDPLAKADLLYSQTFEETAEATFTIRPVWIIGDLPIIYDWLSSDLCKTNWQLNQSHMAVMQHYKHMLLSENLQSLMIEQRHKPVLQIDLLPLRLTDYPGQLEFTETDYVIHYLYRESFRDPDMFKRGLECMLLYLFSYADTRNLYIRLQKADLPRQKLLQQMGFELVHLNNFFGKSLNIYRIKRSGIRF